MKKILAFSLCLLVLAGPAGARVWNPTPQQAAQDYSTITHNKGAQGRVTVTWISSPGLAGTMRQVLDRFVIITITHTTSVTGVTEYEDVAGVTVADQAGQPLTEILPVDFPPVIVTLIAGLESTVKQNTQGRGKVKTLVFQPGNVRACSKGGGLSVGYAGEKYTFETPMPGCDAP